MQSRRRWKRCLILSLSLTVGGLRTASAGVIPYPDAHVPNPVSYTFTAATTGDVIAYFAGTAAQYAERLGMLDNGVQTSAGFGLPNHASSIGQAFDLGHVTAGDSLVFVVDVYSPNLGNVYSDPSLNVAYDANGTKGHNHVYSTSYTGVGLGGGIPAGTYVGFEDLSFPVSDFNYFDETFVFTNVSAHASATPEPGSITLMGLGLAGFGACRWVRRRYRTAA